MYEISWHSFGPADAIFAFVETRGTRDLHRLTNVPTVHTPTRVSLNYAFYCKIITKLNNEDRRNERQRDCIISDDIINRLRYEEQSKQKGRREKKAARYRSIYRDRLRYIPFLSDFPRVKILRTFS